MKIIPKVVQILETPIAGPGPVNGATTVLYDDGAVFERVWSEDAPWIPVKLPERGVVDVVDPNGEREHPDTVKDGDVQVFMPGEGPAYAQTVRRFLDAPGAVRVTEWPSIVALLERELEAERTVTVYGERTSGTQREARAEARGRSEGLATAARAIKEAFRRGPNPARGGVWEALHDLAETLEQMAKEARP